MANPWQHLNPPVTLSKTLSMSQRPGTAKSRMEREAPRPVIGMLPRALKVRADGLSRDGNPFPVPLAPHRALPPARANDQLAYSGPAEQVTESTPVIPRVSIENYPRCERASLLTPAAHRPGASRSGVEALNGRLTVRSRVEVGQHRCNLDSTGTHDLSMELRKNALIRDLLVLESSVRGLEQDELRRPAKAHLQLAEVKVVHSPIDLARPRAASRLIGPKLRIPLPGVEQPQ